MPGTQVLYTGKKPGMHTSLGSAQVHLQSHSAEHKGEANLHVLDGVAGHHLGLLALPVARILLHLPLCLLLSSLLCLQ